MALKQEKKVPISVRALVARINRRLAKDDRQLRKARGVWDGPQWHADSNLGEFYVVDTYRNALIDHHVDLEELGRETGALAGWEKLQAE